MNYPISEKTTASDLMSSPVISIRVEDTVGDAMRAFMENSISAVAVVDGKGRPMGVITKTDITRFSQERDGLTTVDKHRKEGDDQRPGFRLLSEEDGVRQWMTPMVFSVRPDASVREVATRMVKDGVHHLFVKDPLSERLVGVISTFTLVERLAASLSLGRA